MMSSDVNEGGHKNGDKGPSSKDDVALKKMLMSTSEFVLQRDLQDLTDLPWGDRYSEKVRAYYRGLFERAIDVRNRVKKDQKISHSPILSILHEIVEGDFIDELYEYALSVPSDDELPSHSISVTLASLKVGKGMGYNTKRLLRLGLTAFLENVGMYKISEEILQKKGTLSSNEIDIIRKHPETSARILGEMGEVFKELGEVTRQIHERIDGSGYPLGLKGEEIHEAASIIGLIDVYMAMIKNRPYRDKQIQTNAVKSVLEIGKGKFPPRVVKEFFNQISLFPVNTYVRLNNKSIGRVITTDKKQPMRPTIEILYDGLGRKMEEPQKIKLSESPLLHIAGTVDEKEFR